MAFLEMVVSQTNNELTKASGMPEQGMPGPPKALHWLSCLLCLVFITGPNMALATASIIAGLMISHLVWRDGEGQFPLFVCLYQLLQVFAPIIQAETSGVTLSTYFGGPEFETATWLSLGGVVAFSVGMSIPLRRWAPATITSRRSSRNDVKRINVRRILFAWFILLLMEQLLTGFVRMPSVGTAWRPIGALRFAAILLIFQHVFVTKKHWWMILLILSSETLTGFLSFFSSFKTVYFLLIVAAATYLREDRRLWLPSTLAISAVLALALFWQSIKGEYRRFLNQGEGQQTLNVSLSERLNYLGNNASASSDDSISDVIESTLRRLGYINYFGHCLNQVPDKISHTGGRLWNEAVLNFLKPRILFPDKQIFHDSDRTNEFTGLTVADASKGTSISIGYVGESYIDFGIPLMFAPITIFGLAVGFGYSHIVRITKPRIIGIGIGTSLLLSSVLFLESSNAKMTGALVSSFLVYMTTLAIQKRYAPRWGGAAFTHIDPRKHSIPRGQRVRDQANYQRDPQPHKVH